MVCKRFAQGAEHGYINITINPIITHEGKETVVFVHIRDGVQIGFNFSVDDYDFDGDAGTGFNVQAGDTIKVYVVDVLSNDPSVNPVLLQ